MHPYDYIFIGLAMDIIGALMLAKGFILKDTQAAFNEGQSYYGSNSHLIKSAILQRADAIVGATWLTIGFVLQIWGNLHGGIAASEPGWINSTFRMLAILGIAVLLGALCTLAATRMARVRFYKIIFRNYANQKKGEHKPSDTEWIDRQTRVLDIKRKRNETYEQLLKRVEQRREELGKRYGG